MNKKISRKDFFRVSSTAAASLGLSSAVIGSQKAAAAPAARMDRNGEYTVKIAGRDYC